MPAIAMNGATTNPTMPAPTAPATSANLPCDLKSIAPAMAPPQKPRILALSRAVSGVSGLGFDAITSFILGNESLNRAFDAWMT